MNVILLSYVCVLVGRLFVAAAVAPSQVGHEGVSEEVRDAREVREEVGSHRR